MNYSCIEIVTKLNTFDLRRYNFFYYVFLFDLFEHSDHNGKLFILSEFGYCLSICDFMSENRYCTQRKSFQLMKKLIIFVINAIIIFQKCIFTVL